MILVNESSRRYNEVTYPEFRSFLEDSSDFFTILLDVINPFLPVFFLNWSLEERVVSVERPKVVSDLLFLKNAEVTAFRTNAELQISKNNKAAGARARKASLELEKALKEFRKVSVEVSK